MAEPRAVKKWVNENGAKVDADYDAKQNAKEQMTSLKIQGLSSHTAEEIARKQNLRRELTLEIKKQKKEETKLAE